MSVPIAIGIRYAKSKAYILDLVIQKSQISKIVIYAFIINNEKYSSGNYNYAIGRINLKQLIANRDYIKTENLYFEIIGKEIGAVGDEEIISANEDELVA